MVGCMEVDKDTKKGLEFSSPFEFIILYIPKKS
ncbi:MAG: hypothetical protein ACI9EW_002484 [Cellvibrionaceae bacterium]|jgi:hypothetical protein